MPRCLASAWLDLHQLQLGGEEIISWVFRPMPFAGLRRVTECGKQDGKDLVYMGNVGTGCSRTVSIQIRKQLDTVVSPKSKLTRPIKKPKATWVEPRFYADLEYRDITSEGLLRASSFKGLARK
jgi:bifunctional non-homologous end joining protein LigD